MVAAWIRAETGVGPAMASGSQTYSGICADLPHAPTSSSSADGGEQSGAFERCLAPASNTVREIERAELRDDQKHGQREAEIADAVHDERLVAGVGGELLIEIESDQQVAAQSHAFPADEQHQVIGAPAPASA